MLEKVLTKKGASPVKSRYTLAARPPSPTSTSMLTFDDEYTKLPGSATQLAPGGS